MTSALGRQLHDPQGLEGAPGSVAGLGWLDLETTLAVEKRLQNRSAQLQFGERVAVAGYEIHMGVTTGPALERPLLTFADGGRDGAISQDGQVLGTYLHGLFDAPDALNALLGWAGAGEVEHVDLAARREADLERLADAIAAHMDLRALEVATGLAPGVLDATASPALVMARA